MLKVVQNHAVAHAENLGPSEHDRLLVPRCAFVVGEEVGKVVRRDRDDHDSLARELSLSAHADQVTEPDARAHAERVQSVSDGLGDL